MVGWINISTFVYAEACVFYPDKWSKNGTIVHIFVSNCFVHSAATYCERKMIMMMWLKSTDRPFNDYINQKQKTQRKIGI